jgi:hypothetical protein
LFNGETRIQPEQLLEYGTDESITYKIGENIFSIKRNRDSMKLYQNGTVFSLFGMEDQMKIHYGAPVRLVLYYGEKEWDGAVKLSDMMEIPLGMESYVRDYQLHLLQINQLGELDFKNQENQYFFKLSNELFHCKDRASRKALQERCADLELDWETAAIGVVTGSNY